MPGGQDPTHARTHARKKPAIALYGEPGLCPYMGIRKWLRRLPYVSTSKISSASSADPVAGRLCSPV